MITVSRCLGITTAVSILIAWVQFNQFSVLAFTETPTFGFVFLGVFAVLLVGFDYHDWKSAYGALFKSRQAVQAAECDAARRWFFVAGSAAVLSGALSFLIFVVGAINETSDPIKIQASVGIALLGPVYGLSLAVFVCWPLAIACKSSPENGSAE